MAYTKRNDVVEVRSFVDYSPELFKQVLLNRSITPAQLAEKMQVSPTTARAYGGANASPMVHTVKRVASALGVHPQELCSTPPADRQLIHLRCFSGLTRSQAALALELEGELYEVWETRGDITYDWDSGRQSTIPDSDAVMCRRSAAVFGCKVTEVKEALARTRQAHPWG